MRWRGLLSIALVLLSASCGSDWDSIEIVPEGTGGAGGAAGAGDSPTSNGDSVDEVS